MIDFIKIDHQTQRLHGFCLGRLVFEAPVSTAKKGLGEQIDSNQTPRGRHMIRGRLGCGLPMYAILKGRRFTGKIFQLGIDDPKKDWILTRILWLSGLEVGVNRGGSVDTLSRYIYLHGTAQEDLIGQPASHGCIRLKNEDILVLFGQVELGTQVLIV